MKQRIALLLALSLPIAMLAAMVLHHHWMRAHGQRIELPISGYDPRDLLAGHYLRYRVDYGVDACGATPNLPAASICLEPRRAFVPSDRPGNCSLYLRGRCRLGRFEAGIERYYLPQTDAATMERLVRQHHAALRLSVTPDGDAAIVALLIDGRPWRGTGHAAK